MNTIGPVVFAGLLVLVTPAILFSPQEIVASTEADPAADEEVQAIVKHIARMPNDLQ